VSNNAPPQSLDVSVIPLYQDSTAIGTAVFFSDVSVMRDLEEQLRHSTQELEEAYQEVQSTNEELETTNEELQSTIEELETTNEELQSTNEELETMNEELQSTNDELHAVNEELRLRSDELDELNVFLQAILTSFGGGVVVVDTHRRVRIWNSRAEDLWGVREDEVRGEDLATIDIGLPVVQLISHLEAVLDSESSVGDIVVNATTRRGRSVRCRVGFTQLRSREQLSGAILVMDIVESGE
jgi:two-component system CheB/CheR fusion protein